MEGGLRLDECGGLPERLAAIRREPHAMRPALEQCDAEVRFQCLDETGEVRLADPKALCGAMEIQRFRKDERMLQAVDHAV